MSVITRSFIACFLIFIGITCVLKAQSPRNPFNLKKSASEHREISAEPQSDSINSGYPNPFELRTPVLNMDSIGIRQANPWISWIKEKNIYKIKDIEIKSLLFWGLLFLSFLLAIALNINRSVTVKLYRSLVNVNFLSLLYRESREDVSLVFYLLYGLYFIGLSLFLYLVIIHFEGLKAPVYILYITGFVLAIYCLKHLAIKILGYVYGISKDTDRYLFSLVVFNCILAIVLIPSNFIITFVSPAIGEKLMFLVAILIFIILIYRQLREIIFSINLWREHIFHFLLYLCTFEIAPVFVLYSYLTRQGVF
ncbi:MAG: DUF4271 domain-containing protein [Saprospiraceae bacterium]|nr:DUF4271 domain-containing protein [Saprospiraceae bacterium]